MPDSSRPDPRKYVVIGGGLAGLASAVWLAEAGKQVTLLERRGSLGGRTHAMKVSVGLAELGDLPDNGQHVIASGYENVFRYLESVGTREFVKFEGHGATRWPDGRVVESWTSGPRALKGLFGGHPDASIADQLRTAVATVRLGWSAFRPPADAASITTAELFERIGMPSTAREAFWDWFALGVAAEPVDRACAKVLLDLMATGARQAVRLRTPVGIGYPTTDLDSLYITGAENTFNQYGVQVLHRAVARRINISAGNVTGVSLADGSVVPADAVVCAVPNSNITGLLDDLPEHQQIYAAAAALSHTPIVSTNLYLDRPLGTVSAMEALIGGTGVIDEVFDRQRMHHRSTDGGTWLYCLTTSGAYEQIQKTNDEIVAEQLELLRRYYPAAREANVVLGHVVRMPKATYSQVVGTYGLRPDQRTSVPSLVLAGDWTRHDWSATMEGAAQSAARAVDLLLKI